MSEHGEHLAALVMTALAVIFAFVSVYGWSGVPQHPVASRVLKWVVFFGAAVWGIYSAVVIWRNRGTNPWTNLNWQDVVAIQAYALASWRWLAIAVIALFAFLIGRSTKSPIETETKGNEATADETLSLSDGLACEDASLHELVRADKQSIESRVKVYVITWKPQFGEETLRPYIDFWFGVFNISLTEVIVTSDKNPGAIKFQKEGQENPADFEERPRLEPDQPITMQPRSSGLVVVRQWISRDIAKEIQESGDKSHFWFSGLRLTVSGDGIPEKKLDTNHVITKVENYQAYYEPVLCFGYDADSHVSNEIATSQAEIAQLQAENAKLNEAIGGKRQQYKTLSQKHDEALEQKAALAREIETLKSKLDSQSEADKPFTDEDIAHGIYSHAGVMFQLLESNRQLVFFIRIFNGLDHQVKIVDSAEGFILLDGRPFHKKPEFLASTLSPPDERESTLSFHQHVNDDEFDAIQKAFAEGKSISFDFDSVYVYVEVKGRRHRLGLPERLSCKPGINYVEAESMSATITISGTHSQDSMSE